MVYHLYHPLTHTNEPKPLIVSDGDNMVTITKFSVERRVERLKENNRMCNGKETNLFKEIVASVQWNTAWLFWYLISHYRVNKKLPLTVFRASWIHLTLSCQIEDSLKYYPPLSIVYQVNSLFLGFQTHIFMSQPSYACYKSANVIVDLTNTINDKVPLCFIEYDRSN